jgi:ATP-dependent Lhr-like helicase
MEILNARPYAFLDDAPLEERRTQAVINRRWTDPASTDDMGALDAGAIAAVAAEAWPVRSGDEMHEALMSLAASRRRGGREDGWQEWLDGLAAAGRAMRLHDGSGADLWVARERLPRAAARRGWRAARPAAPCSAWAPGDGAAAGAVAALAAVRNGRRMRRWSRCCGAERLRSADGGGDCRAVGAAGIQRRHRAGAAGERGLCDARPLHARRDDEEWCERHLLARIHRYTIKPAPRDRAGRAAGLHALPVRVAASGADAQLQGIDALPEVLAQLEGYEAAAGAGKANYWRCACATTPPCGWMTCAAPGKSSGPASARRPVRPVAGAQHAAGAAAAPPAGAVARAARRAAEVEVSPRAARVLETLRRNGAMFFDELRRPPAAGRTGKHARRTGRHWLVNADSYAGLRAMLVPANKRASNDKRRRRRRPTMEEAGRWALVRRGD